MKIQPLTRILNPNLQLRDNETEQLFPMTDND
jgi:hypothetical protein